MINWSFESRIFIWFARVFDSIGENTLDERNDVVEAKCKDGGAAEQLQGGGGCGGRATKEGGQYGGDPQEQARGKLTQKAPRRPSITAAAVLHFSSVCGRKEGFVFLVLVVNHLF